MKATKKKMTKKARMEQGIRNCRVSFGRLPTAANLADHYNVNVRYAELILAEVKQELGDG